MEDEKELYDREAKKDRNFVFTNFTFLNWPLTPVYTMQDIFICEKGKEALRAHNLKISYTQKKQQLPDFDRVNMNKIDDLMSQSSKTDSVFKQRRTLKLVKKDKLKKKVEQSEKKEEISEKPQKPKEKVEKVKKSVKIKKKDAKNSIPNKEN